MCCFCNTVKAKISLFSIAAELYRNTLMTATLPVILIRAGIGIRNRVWTPSDVKLLLVLNAAVWQAVLAVHSVFS